MSCAIFGDPSSEYALNAVTNQMKKDIHITFFVAENSDISVNTFAHKTMGLVQWKARGTMLAQSVLTRALVKKQSIQD